LAARFTANTRDQLDTRKLDMLARRSFNLARRVQMAHRAIQLETRSAIKVPQDWSALLNALDCDERPIVVTTAHNPFSIVAVNTAWTSLCGFSHSEAIGSSLKLIQGPSTDRIAVADASRRLTSSAARSNRIVFELVNYTKDRRPFLNSVDVSPIDVTIDGRVTPMFFGALSFKSWVKPHDAPVAAKRHTAPASAAEPEPAAPFTLKQALALSGKPAGRAQRIDARAMTYDLARLNSMLAF
jgi:PAS domain-containing protein